MVLSDVISLRIRKLIFVFKNLRPTTDANIIEMVTGPSVNLFLAYCITGRGGDAKTNILKLERAQRTTLKVVWKIVLHSTTNVYPNPTLKAHYPCLSIRRKQ